jgi:hypothetical protein
LDNRRYVMHLVTSWRPRHIKSYLVVTIAALLSVVAGLAPRPARADALIPLQPATVAGPSGNVGTFFFAQYASGGNTELAKSARLRPIEPGDPSPEPAPEPVPQTPPQPAPVDLAAKRQEAAIELSSEYQTYQKAGGTMVFRAWVDEAVTDFLAQHPKQPPDEPGLESEGLGPIAWFLWGWDMWMEGTLRGGLQALGEKATDIVIEIYTGIQGEVPSDPPPPGGPPQPGGLPTDAGVPASTGPGVPAPLPGGPGPKIDCWGADGSFIGDNQPECLKEMLGL